MIRNTIIDSGEPNGFLEDEFQPVVKFCNIFIIKSCINFSHWKSRKILLWWP